MNALARRNPWLVVACGAFIVTLAMGVRQSFGLFMRPIGLDIGIGRDMFGLAIAFQNLLFGLVQPFIGALADKHGAGRITAVGALVYAAGLLTAASATSAFGLHLSFGVLIGLAMSATTFVTVLGAVGRVVPAEKRTLAFGLTTAGGSLGQFLVVPAAQGLLSELGWRSALIVMAGVVSLVFVLAAGIAGKPPEAEEEGPPQSLSAALAEASRHRGYWLLNAGFFVCGFHIAFIATHFPAYLTDKGLDAKVGAMSLALVGLFNIFGSYLFGAWGDRWRKNYLLSGIYTARALLIVVFVSLPLGNVTALAFAAGIGFLWLGTVPLTSGLVTGMFGVRYLSMLYGIVFLSHQVGSFFGAWAAGYAYDLTGNYDFAWGASIALGLLAGLVHLPIRDEGLVARPAA
ncbi:MFS transporter [Sphingoaurantiacus capsulatus]|uniref:MFS transporter n=1 Tax=Sphingoaurantiacus capsulatus TaxID=1771310 RepID=A0ABV7XC34_9SPHN